MTLETEEESEKSKYGNKHSRQQKKRCPEFLTACSSDLPYPGRYSPKQWMDYPTILTYTHNNLSTNLWEDHNYQNECIQSINKLIMRVGTVLMRVGSVVMRVGSVVMRVGVLS